MLSFEFRKLVREFNEAKDNPGPNNDQLVIAQANLIDFFLKDFYQEIERDLEIRHMQRMR